MNGESWVLMGGTFDPIHNGHLNMALSAVSQLGVTNLAFVPCHITPHKDQPSTDSAHRLQMIQLCLESTQFKKSLNKTPLRKVSIENYELAHDRPSFTVHTLEHLRNKLGGCTPIYWLIGMDSLNSLNTWYCWERLLDLAHIVVANRPGHPLTLNGELDRWWAAHAASIESLKGSTYGHCVMINTKEFDVSSTSIRQLIADKKNVRDLVPECVDQYIKNNKLYLISE